MHQMFERLLINNRRYRSLSFARNEPQTNCENQMISENEWLAKFDREKVTKADVDMLVYDFLRMEGQRDAADSFRFETDLQCTCS